MHKLGVIVPYRNRPEHLSIFEKSIREFLHSRFIVDFELIIIEQVKGKGFNRGMLLNIGFKEAKKLGCDYVVFHDVDMIPIDVNYCYSEFPVHLATNFKSDIGVNRIVFDEYFGGVTLFPIEMFESINGYSNEYWGWGYEDDDLLYRCNQYGIDLDTKEIKMMGGNTAAIEFNGVNGYIQSKNIINPNKFLTIFISFYPDEIICNPHKDFDEYSIFTVPGYDLSISYNSFKRYRFDVYDSNKNLIHIDSEIKSNYKTNICVTINPVRKEIQMYQDGMFVDSKKYTGELYHYDDENMFIGTGTPYYEENPKYFKGLFTTFAVFDRKLNDNEIMEISTNQFFGLTTNFGKYISSNHLKLYYDAKIIKNNRLIDLSENGNDGKIENCNVVGYTFDNMKRVSVPYRRKSTFKLLSHEENGYMEGKWKEQSTRHNQSKYHNEVSIGKVDPKNDGLSNCEFLEISRTKNNNQTHIVVSI